MTANKKSSKLKEPVRVRTKSRNQEQISVAETHAGGLAGKILCHSGAQRNQACRETGKHHKNHQPIWQKHKDG